MVKIPIAILVAIIGSAVSLIGAWLTKPNSRNLSALATLTGGAMLLAYALYLLITM